MWMGSHVTITKNSCFVSTGMVTCALGGWHRPSSLPILPRMMTAHDSPAAEESAEDHSAVSTGPQGCSEHL